MESNVSNQTSNLAKKTESRKIEQASSLETMVEEEEDKLNRLMSEINNINSCIDNIIERVGGNIDDNKDEERIRPVYKTEASHRP